MGFSSAEIEIAIYTDAENTYLFILFIIYIPQKKKSITSLQVLIELNHI